jgi:D-inositol-3-phosphate glycosyltransferase
MPRSSPLKIIAIGYNTAGTGLTRVMNSIMGRLAGRHEIHYLGIGYSGEVINDRGMTIYPTNPKGGDIFAAFQAKKLVEEINPDLLFILHDVWMFEYYLRLLGPYRDRLKIIAFIPLDGDITDAGIVAPLEAADCVVVYTYWARNQFESAFERLREEKPAAVFPSVEVIPHGIDSRRFHPFPALLELSFAASGRTQARQKVFGDMDGGGGEPFVVLNASRPDIRKRIDLTIAGFAEFALEKPASVRLCLHHAIMGPKEREMIETMAHQFGIEDRLNRNPLGDTILPDDQLNLLYNACDVGLNTSMGEGWGLVSFEHGASGATQVVPDHSACAELWREHGELIPVARSYVPGFSVLELGEVSPEAVASTLEKLYRDPRRCQDLAAEAYGFAQDESYSWDAAAEKFHDLFIEVAGS